MKPKCKIRYSVKWNTKEKKETINNQNVTDLKRVLLEKGKEINVQIIKGRISKTTVLLMISAPPSICVSKIIQNLKGKTSRIINIEWEKGYICKTI